MTYRLLGIPAEGELEQVLWEDSREENCAYCMEMESSRGTREMRIVHVTVPESSAKVELPKKEELYGVFQVGFGGCIYPQKQAWYSLEGARAEADKQAHASGFKYGVYRMGDVL